MKKQKRLVALVVLALAGTAWAGFRAEPVADPRSGETTFGIAVDLTALEGQAREHVFERADSRRQQLSRLDWDMEAVTFLGVKGSARRGIFSLNLGAWAGASAVDDADMKDYDWEYGDQVGYNKYSRSDTELDEAWMLDANLSADLFRGEALSAYAFLGWRVQHWEWECNGRNDYLYSELGGEWVHDTGHILDYEQELDFAYVGLGGKWKLSDAFDVSGYVSWAPAYEGKDKDDHLAKDTRYHEKFHYDDGNVYAAGLEVAWHMSEKSILSLGLDWQKATLHEGDMTKEDADGRTTFKDNAGIENEYLAGTLAFRYAF